VRQLGRLSARWHHRSLWERAIPNYWASWTDMPSPDLAMFESNPEQIGDSDHLFGFALTPPSQITPRVSGALKLNLATHEAISGYIIEMGALAVNVRNSAGLACVSVRGRVFYALDEC
jgi:hypothetical protein